MATQNQAIISSQNVMIQNQRDMLIEFRGLATMVKVTQAIPAQVLLSTPVILLDALGRRAPFHLEFVDSAEVCAHINIRQNDLALLTIHYRPF